ncbi:MAG: hypothetical protein Q9225_002107 [Loekoesia sp. 1 TL-2023]
MAPPPIPVDPAIDSWRSSNIALSPGLSLDNLIQSSPRLADRQNLSGQSNLDNFSQDVQLPAMKQHPTDPDPLLRFWNDTGPWNSQRVGVDPGQASSHPRFATFGDQMRRNFPAMPYDYRSPRSEIGSSTTGRYPVDSGYGGSKSLATPSARSVDQLDHGQSGLSISGDVHDFHPFAEDRYQDSLVRNGPSPHDQYSSMDVLGDNGQPTAVTFELACSYQNCGTISKNQSEHR